MSSIAQPGAAATARSRRLRGWLLAGCACLIIYVTLFPFTGWRPATRGWWLLDVAINRSSWSDMAANVLLYVPLGFLLALGRRVRSLPSILLVALLLSLGLETAQAFIPGRVSSLLDVALNVFGAGAGAVAAPLLRWPYASVRHAAMAHLQGDRVAWIGIAALAAWGCAQLIPFVPSLDIGNLKHGLKPLWLALHGAAPINPWRFAVYVLATAALTVMGASALRFSRWGWITALILLAVLPAKAIVIGRQLSPEACFGTLVGVAIGIMLWANGRRRALWIAAILVPVYVLAESLQPGAAGTTTHAVNWIPLRQQLIQPLTAMANLADSVWPMLALACLCLRLGMSTLWLLLPPVAVLVAGAEWAQRWVPGRYPDVTTVLVGIVAWIAAAAYAGRQTHAGNDAD